MVYIVRCSHRPILDFAYSFGNEYSVRLNLLKDYGISWKLNWHREISWTSMWLYFPGYLNTVQWIEKVTL